MYRQGSGPVAAAGFKTIRSKQSNSMPPLAYGREVSPALKLRKAGQTQKPVKAETHSYGRYGFPTTLYPVFKKA
jgi:hypothetical protein